MSDPNQPDAPPPGMPPTVTMTIVFNPATGQVNVNHPIDKNLCLLLIGKACEIVARYQPQKVVVAQQAPAGLRLLKP